VTPEELEAALRAAGIAVRPNGMLRASELRRFLNVSDGTLQAWRAQGKPPSGVRLNGQWHYPVVAVAGNAEVGQTCSAA
jgi:hypothetical protein